MEDRSCRPDGRSAGEMRAIAIEQGLLTKADGSARVVLGSSRALSAVYGPAEALIRDELVEKAAIEVIFEGEDNKVAESALASLIESVCLSALHPRTAIRVVVQLLSEDGSSFAAAVNSAMVALLDAGIQLSSVFVAVTCAVLPNGTILVDPVRQEEEQARAVVDLVFDGSHQGVLCSQCRGGVFVDPAQYLQCVDLAARMSKSMVAFLRKTTENRFKKK